MPLEFTEGEETQVNTYTEGDQFSPVITPLADGGFVIVWTSYAQDGSGYGIYAQSYNHSAAKFGPETHINFNTIYDQSFPAITSLPDGGYVIAWVGDGQDGSYEGIYARRYDSSGATIGAETAINTYTFAKQADPAITSLTDGGYVITWTSLYQDGSYEGIYAQRFDAIGTKLGPETRINTNTLMQQLSPAITSLSDGGYVITWTSDGQDGSGWGIFAQRFDASGIAVGSETLVNTYTTSSQHYPAITALTDGGYVITWMSNGQVGSGWDIFAQRFDAFGVAVGAETRINTYTKHDLWYPAITALSDGGYVITWMSDGQDGSDWGIYTKRFDASGTQLGLETRINTTTLNGQANPAITTLSDGSYVITWTSYGQDGSDYGIYQKVFSPINRAPALTGIPSDLATGSEDTAYIVSTADLVSGFTDEDGDTLIAENLFVDHGTVVDNGDGTFTLTPSANYFGVVTIGYDVSDGRGGRVNTSREITFADVVDYFIGTPDSQILSGTDGADYIDGAAGNDAMLGYGGDDTYVVDSRKDAVLEYENQGIDTVEASVTHYLWANVENLTLIGSDSIFGVGNELANVITGNSGDNQLFGIFGNDTLSGGAGLDVLVGGDGDDSLDGGIDIDRLKGGTGNDNLMGGAGDDNLKGEDGNDYLDGGLGSDTVLGGIGDDTYVVDDALDFLFEVTGEGYDRVESSITYTLRNYFEDLSLTGVANINGIGNTENNVITGNDGNNQLFGMFGNDTIYGGLGNDTVVGGDSNDILYGEAGNDQLKGGYGNDSLFGGNANDNLKGEENHDYLDGGLGIDSMYGGAGNDTYVASELGDFYVENLNEGTDTVLASITFTLGNNLENLTLTGTDNINGTGNAGFNVLLGNDGNNTLSGMDGTDRITGGAGNDTLLGGNGNDTYYFDLGFGQDEINDAVGTNRITFGAGISATDVITEVVGADLYVALKDADPLVTASNATNRIKILGGATVAPTITYTPAAIVAESSALSAAITTFSAPTGSALLSDSQADTTKPKTALAAATKSLWQFAA